MVPAAQFRSLPLLAACALSATAAQAQEARSWLGNSAPVEAAPAEAGSAEEVVAEAADESTAAPDPTPEDELPIRPAPAPPAPRPSAERDSGASSDAAAAADPAQVAAAQPADEAAWSQLLLETWTVVDSANDRPTHLFSFGRYGRFFAAELHGNRPGNPFCGTWRMEGNRLISEIESFPTRRDWEGRRFADQCQLMADGSLQLTELPSPSEPNDTSATTSPDSASPASAALPVDQSAAQESGATRVAPAQTRRLIRQNAWY